MITHHRWLQVRLTAGVAADAAGEGLMTSETDCCCAMVVKAHATSTVPLAVGETVVLLHPPPPSAGVSIRTQQGRQQNDRTLGPGPSADPQLAGHRPARRDAGRADRRPPDRRGRWAGQRTRKLAIGVPRILFSHHVCCRLMVGLRVRLQVIDIGSDHGGSLCLWMREKNHA